MNRYEALAAKFEERVSNGKLLPGDRLPSVRELSLREQVSPTTVVEAYQLLVERGYIESRDRSGFFVAEHLISPALPEHPVRSVVIEDPFALRPDDLIFALRQAAHEPKIVPFGAATPAPEFFPYKTINRCVQLALRDEPALSSEYAFPPGSETLRIEIAKRYRKFEVDIDENSIVTTTGAIEAINHALRAVVKPGELVMLESPTYFGILQTVSSLGYSVLEVPTHPTRGIDPERFEQAILGAKGKLKAAVVVPSCSNPLGSVMSDDDKRALVEIAHRHGVILVEDDVYADLSFEKHRPKPLKAFDKHDEVILCGSFAKTISPGLRVGFVISTKHHKQLSLLRSAAMSGTSVVSEEAVAVYLKAGGYDRHVKRVSREYKTLIAKFSAKILCEFPPGTRVVQPRGGYVLWVQLPEKYDARVIQKRALEKSISIAPGPIFSAQLAYKNCLRINCAIPWSPRIERAIGTLGKLF